jgi:hypothetical protein
MIAEHLSLYCQDSVMDKGYTLLIEKMGLITRDINERPVFGFQLRIFLSLFLMEEAAPSELECLPFLSTQCQPVITIIILLLSQT